jgi:hypothetical protein
MEFCLAFPVPTVTAIVFLMAADVAAVVRGAH